MNAGEPCTRSFDSGATHPEGDRPLRGVVREFLGCGRPLRAFDDDAAAWEAAQALIDERAEAMSSADGDAARMDVPGIDDAIGARNCDSDAAIDLCSVDVYAVHDGVLATVHGLVEHDDVQTSLVGSAAILDAQLDRLRSP